MQVEISYREAVVDEPAPAYVGGPFYEDFELLTTSVEEMAAEKLRALAQRLRPTDLADLAVMPARSTTSHEKTARLALVKFELVAKGLTNRLERLEKRAGPPWRLVREHERGGVTVEIWPAAPGGVRPVTPLAQHRRPTGQ